MLSGLSSGFEEKISEYSSNFLSIRVSGLFVFWYSYILWGNRNMKYGYVVELLHVDTSAAIHRTYPVCVSVWGKHNGELSYFMSKYDGLCFGMRKKKG